MIKRWELDFFLQSSLENKIFYFFYFPILVGIKELNEEFFSPMTQCIFGFFEFDVHDGT